MRWFEALWLWLLDQDCNLDYDYFQVLKPKGPGNRDYSTPYSILLKELLFWLKEEYTQEYIFMTEENLMKTFLKTWIPMLMWMCSKLETKPESIAIPISDDDVLTFKTRLKSLSF